MVIFFVIKMPEVQKILNLNVFWLMFFWLSLPESALDNVFGRTQNISRVNKFYVFFEKVQSYSSTKGEKLIQQFRRIKSV